MKELIAKRIKSARMLARMSLRELSDALNNIVSHNAIQKYENAEMMPDSKVLLALSNVLGVKSDYFFMPYNVEVSNIEFRKNSKLTNNFYKCSESLMFSSSIKLCQLFFLN